MKGKLSSNIVHWTGHPLVSSYQILWPLPGTEAWPLSPLLRLWNVSLPFLHNPFNLRDDLRQGDICWSETVVIIRRCYLVGTLPLRKHFLIINQQQFTTMGDFQRPQMKSCKSNRNENDVKKKNYIAATVVEFIMFFSLRCVLKMDHHCPW